MDYFLQYNNVAWNELDNTFLNKFKAYALRAGSSFDALAKGSKAINYAWERAVLCKGMYFIQKRNMYNMYNMLHSVKADNARRDYSWYRLLRLSMIQGDEWNQKQSFVQQVFDDPLFDPANVVQSLEAICSSTINPTVFDEANWQHLLITTPSLFELSEKGFVVLESNTLILMHQSQRNHNQSEIRTAYFYEKLREENFDVSPFSRFFYSPQRGTEIIPRLEIKGFQYDGIYYQIDVRFEDTVFVLTFKTMFRQHTNMHGSVKEILAGLGFVFDDWISMGIEQMYCSMVSITEVRSVIHQLCLGFKGLLND